MHWLSIEFALAVHEAQIAEHGGTLGIRDRGILEAALARPQNLLNCQPSSDVAAIAAMYAIGIARNHPFVDGNKRTALIALEVFLNLNGCDLEATDAECVVHVLAMAAGESSDDDFTSWVRASCTAKRDEE